MEVSPEYDIGKLKWFVQEVIQNASQKYIEKTIASNKQVWSSEDNRYTGKNAYLHNSRVNFKFSF